MAKQRQLKQKKKVKTVTIRPRRRAAPAPAQEVGLLGQALRSLGGLGGGALGSVFGAPATGAAVGSSLGGAISKWLGAGDYSVNTNSIVQKSLKAASSIPMMHNDEQSIIVRHKEYLGEVLSSTAFTVQQTYPINPGMSQTFPWLSGIANKFQEYKIRGMVYHYIPTSGSAVSATNAALGSVMLQTTYRSTDAAPSSKLEILNEYCSNESVPSEPFAHPVECDPRENPFNVQYVRSGSVPSSDTQLMYDLGATHLAVSGCQSTGNVLGDLWVTYEVELKKPIVYSNVTAGVFSASGTVLAPPTVGGIFGTTSPTQCVGPMVASLFQQTITISKGNAGRYLVYVDITGTGLSLAGGSGPVYTNCVALKPIAGSGATAVYNFGATITNMVFGVEIPDNAVTASVNVSLTGTFTTLTASRVIIAELA